MSLAGDLVSLVVSLAQEIGIIAGVGAVTMTLVGHLLSLHAHKSEIVFGYVRAARHIRALMLALIIISGGAAILIHIQAGTLGVLMAPAYVFKWLIIILLTAFYFAELKVDGIKRDAVEGFEGANWYALFIVHTMAPVVDWGLLLGIYLGWLAAFTVVWAVFVWLMRRHSTIIPKSGLGPNPFPPPSPAPVTLKPAPAPVSVIPTPAPVARKTIEIHPNHSMLPTIAELDLPAPSKVGVPAPKPSALAQIVPELPKPPVRMPNLEEAGLAALHVMPKRPEDIDSSKRGPVVKMSDDI